MEPRWRPSRLPESRAARVALARRDSLEYVGLLGTEDEDKLLESLAKLTGITRSDEEGWRSEKYNVALEFLPEGYIDG